MICATRAWKCIVHLKKLCWQFEAGDVGDLILIAQIVGAHGLRGDLTARIYADDANNLKRYGRLSDKSGQRSFDVTSIRMGAKGAIIRLKGVTDRTEADTLRGLELYVARSALPDADDGSYYHADLVGLTAVSVDGAAIGRVVGVQNYGAGDLLEISVKANETVLIPFRDQFVPTVDVKGGMVVIVAPIMIDGSEQRSTGLGDNAGHDDEE